MENAKAMANMVGSFVLVAFAATLAGSIVRGEMSPWMWEELTNPHVAGSFSDKAVGVIWYMSFYSLGFVLPYWLTTFVLFLRQTEATRVGSVQSSPSNHRAGRLLTSFATLVLFLLLLDSIVAFIRELPTEKWNGWLLILGLAVAAFLALAAYLAFTRPSSG